MKPAIRVMLDEREGFHSKWLERVQELQKLDSIEKNAALSSTHFINLLKVVDDHHKYRRAEDKKAKKIKNYSKLVKLVDKKLSKPVER